MPLLLLSLLVLLWAPDASAKTVAKSKPEKGKKDKNLLQEKVSLKPNVEKRLKLNIPRRYENHSLHVEWLPNALSTAPVALLASVNYFEPEQKKAGGEGADNNRKVGNWTIPNGTVPDTTTHPGWKKPEIRFKGHADPAGKTEYVCSPEKPCFDAQRADAASFFRSPGYAFLRMHEGRARWMEILVMYRPGADETNPLAGEVSVRASREKECGSRRLAGEPLTTCGGGKCEEGACKCPTDLFGRFCQTKSPRLSSRIGERIVLKAGWVYRTHYHIGRDSYLQFVAEAANAKDMDGVTVVVKKEYNRCSDDTVTRDDSRMPTLRDRGCFAVNVKGKSPKRRFLASDLELSNGDAWLIGVHATKEHAAIDVKITPCDARGRRCVNGGPSSNQTGRGGRKGNSQAFAFLILPICLSILCLAAAVICVLLYVDRRHGFVTGPDRLTPKELALMCPEFVYGADDDDDGAGGGAGATSGEQDTRAERDEDNVCSICLCEFEQGDALRQLQCNHRYHCECVDPWLTQANASCPTCRQAARVPELSEKRYLRALAKHILVPLLRIPQQNRNRNRLRAAFFFRRRGRREEEDDVEEPRAAGQPDSGVDDRSPSSTEEDGISPPPPAAVVTGALLPTRATPPAKFPDRHRRRSSAHSLAATASASPSGRRSFERVQVTTSWRRGAEEAGSAPDLRVRPRVRDMFGARHRSDAHAVYGRSRDNSTLSGASGMTDTSFVTAPLHFEAALLASHGILPPRVLARPVAVDVEGAEGEGT